jgi:outer membrane protein
VRVTRDRLLRDVVCLAAAALFAAGPLRAQSPGARPDSTAHPLSLVEALALAERESEAVGLARSDISRAEGQRRQARSGYFPQLSGSATYQRALRSQFSVFARDTTDTATAAPTECPGFTPRPGLSVEERLDSLESAVECASAVDPFAAVGDLPFGRANTYRFGLSASQLLFSGGRVSGQSQSASASVRSAELGLTAARAQVLLDVTQAYYDAALGDRLVRIAEATLEQADTTLTQSRLAQQVGNQSEFELLRARVTRDNQRPVVIQRRADREIAYYRLKQLLNIPLEQALALTTTLGDTSLVHAPQLTAVVAAAGDTSTAARVPVRQAAEAVTSQQGLLRAARSQHLPQLTLSSDFAELGYPGNGSPVGTDYLADWTVSVGLSLPLFTGGRIRGQVEAARADLESARLRLQQTRERADLDARSAAIQLQSALAGWSASEGTAEQAARAYQIAEIRFREGISTQTELNDQRIQLAVAESNRARAARDLQVAKIRLALLPALPLPGQATTTTATSSTATSSTTAGGTAAPTGGTSTGLTPQPSGTGGTTQTGVLAQ